MFCWLIDMFSPCFKFIFLHLISQLLLVDQISSSVEVLINFDRPNINFDRDCIIFPMSIWFLCYTSIVLIQLQLCFFNFGRLKLDFGRSCSISPESTSFNCLSLCFTFSWRVLASIDKFGRPKLVTIAVVTLFFLTDQSH